MNFSFAKALKERNATTQAVALAKPGSLGSPMKATPSPEINFLNTTVNP
jgi:hypothetical protein